MKRRIIEVQETWKVNHQIYVEYEDEYDLSLACDCTEEADYLDDFVAQISDYVTVTDVNRNYFEDSDGIEYFDDYDVEE